MTFDFSKYRDRLLFVPLGGSNEVGMNLNLYTTQGKWLMVDCGIGFAGDYFPGIEVIVPDIEFIAERKKDLLGLVLTHAHEDHIGAVPYLWRELECPIYATPFTAALLTHKFNEMGPGKKPVITEIQPSSKLTLGPFEMDLIGITHSIPEMQGIAIKAAGKTVLHTGDWKFDENPMVGPASDYEKLEQFGDGKVSAIVCDSTNVFVDGEAGSEETVREHLTELISRCKQRVVVTTFASNIARLETILLASHKAGRITALAGRSMHRMIDAAHDASYLVSENEFVSDREIMNVPRQDALIVCTGSQGEPRAALTRIARGDHPTIKLSRGDTVIFASRKIPGNDARIHWIINQLIKSGVEVITDRDFFIHVSGHPARQELKRMYELVRPAIAIPTHGETRHLHEHAKFAKSLGVKETVQAQNGAVVLIDEGEASVIGQVKSGYIAIDGVSLIPTDGTVIRQRRRLRDEGAVFVSVTLSRDTELAAPVQLDAPGVLDAELDGDLIDEVIGEVEDAVEKVKPRSGDEQIRELVLQVVKKSLSRELGKKPLVVVHISRAGVK